MDKADFLTQSAPFSKWFADLITEKLPLDFRHEQGIDRSLRSALERYRWPNKRIDIPTPRGLLSIAAHGSFAANAAVLLQLEIGLRRCLDAAQMEETELANWAAAIMRWGGVYTKRGNGPWLDSKRASFSAYLRPVLRALSDTSGIAHLGIVDLRSNAGTTKIHSLALPQFVIYDSRVAGALAWLVLRWSRHQNAAVPAHLRFACMRANTTKSKVKMRSPDETLFPYFAASGPLLAHQRHATWNLRANWIISDALTRANAVAGQEKWSPRQVEAALFMMGADLAPAMRDC